MAVEPLAAPVCEFGSRIKPSIVNNQFWQDASTALTTIASFLGPLAPYVTPLVGAITPKLIDLEPLCASTPPAPPTVDLQTLFLSGQWAAIPQWFVDWFWAVWSENQWTTFCECTPGPSTGCEYTFDGLHHFTGNGQMFELDFGPKPPGTTNIDTYATVTGPPGSNVNYQVLLRTNTNASCSTAVTGLINSGVEKHDTSAWSSGSSCTHYSIRVTTNSGYTGGADAYIKVCVNWVGCSTTPPTTPYTPLPPPPPPDVPPPPALDTSCDTAELCSRLDQLQRMLSIISTEVDLTYLWTHEHLPVDCPDCISGAPSFSPGASHVGLTGTGSTPIGDLVGMRVQVTGHPTGTRELAGQPEYLWNMGWMSILNGDSLLEEKRVTRDSFVWLPYSMKLADSFTWTLRDGVTLEAIELEPA